MQHLRFIVAALIALGALFVGFSWWVWSAAEMSIAIPIACTAFTVLVGLSAVLVPRLRARRGAEALEKALKSRDSGGEGRSAEIDRMRREFETAMQALKSSRLSEKGGSQNRDALSVLPWYAIIGPPASGKTTALQKSGLRFPHVKGTGQRPNLKGLGGTRNLDWFLTDEAILIDTAGRWSVEEAGADRQEWDSFLRLLRKHRPDKPLNGVILAVSLSEDLPPGVVASVDDSPNLVGLDEAGLRILAERMRERLEEISHELGVRLPVYVLFTKCDLLSGFAEMFGSMSERERQQIWGFNTRIGETSGDLREYLGPCFDELAGSLERRALARMQEEAGPEELERLFGFPGQFSALREKLIVYLENLLHDSSYSEAPILRGVYFTCGTQEGSPAQAVADDLAITLGINEQIAVGERREESYFLFDMLKKVVFQDKDLATASDAELLRRRKFRRTWMTTVTAASAVVLLFGLTSYVVNQGLLDRTRAALPDDTQGPSADALWPLYEESVRLEHGRPTFLASVFYQGNALSGPVRTLFAQQLQRRVLRKLYGDNTVLLKSAVTALEPQPPAQQSAEQRHALSEALELHLLLAQRQSVSTKECPIPSPQAEATRIVERLLALWDKRERARTPEVKAQREAMLKKYLALLSPKPDVLREELAFSPERAYVGRARSVLGSDDSVERALSAVAERYGRSPLGTEMLADPSTFISQQTRIPGEFTRDAWRQVERDVEEGRLLDANAGAGCWLLGGSAKSDEERQQSLGGEMRARYLDRYATSWKTFVQGLSTRTPVNLSDAETLFLTLPVQLDALFQRVKDHTTPPPSSGAKQVVGQAVDALKDKLKDKLPGADPSAIAGVNPLDELATFTRYGAPASAGMPVPLDTFRQQLAPVQAALAALKTDASRIRDVKNALELALNGLRPSLASYGAYRATLERLMLAPLETALGIANGGVTADLEEQLQQAYCAEVYAPYKERIAGRFPFKRDFGTGVRVDDLARGNVASLDAITALLAPKQGALWAFADKTLAGYLVNEGTGYRFGERDGRGGASLLRDELLRFLKRARAVGNALFSGDSPTPRFRFDVVLRGGNGIARSRFMLGGQELARYDNGALATVSVEWPGKDPNAGVELQFDLDDRSRAAPLQLPGPWGLFLLVDGTGCRDAQSAACTTSGRCDPTCSWYGANAAQAKQACASQSCYWGINANVRARVQDRGISLSVPVGRDNVSAHIDVRDVSEGRPLTDLSVFDLRLPSRITARAGSGCGGD